MEGDFRLEEKPLTAKILKKTEMTKDVVELLLENKGRVIYCWLEGEHWVRKIKLIGEGEGLCLTHYRWYSVPSDSSSLCIPPVPGKAVIPGYIYTPASDSIFQLTPLIARTYPSLSDIVRDAATNPWTKRDLIGVIVDVSFRDLGPEALITLGLVDESVRKSLFACVLTKKQDESAVKLLSIGDVMTIHGCTLQLYNEKPQVSASRSLSGWGIFSFTSGDIIAQSQRFSPREETTARYAVLRSWADTHFRTHSTVMLQDSLPSLGALPVVVYKKVDFIAKVIEVREGMPEGKSTVALGDEAGATLVELTQMRGFTQGNWVKVCKAKISRSLDVSQYSAVVSIPDHFFDVQIHLQNYAVLGDCVENEARRKLLTKVQLFEDVKERVVSQCTDSSLPFWTFQEALSPFSPRHAVRVKGLFVDLQPSPVAAGFYQEGRMWKYCGLLRLYSNSEVMNILLTESSARDFFSLPSFLPNESTIFSVHQCLRLLAHGNNWVEAGVQRAVAGDTVQFRLYQTRVVSKP